jgi:hypothetical protein
LVGTTIDLIIEVSIIGDLEVDGAGTMVSIIGGTILFGTRMVIIMHSVGVSIMALIILMVLTDFITIDTIIIQEAVEDLIIIIRTE